MVTVKVETVGGVYFGLIWHWLTWVDLEEPRLTWLTWDDLEEPGLTWRNPG